MLPVTQSKFLPHELEFLSTLDEYQARYVFSKPDGVSSVIAAAGSGKSHSTIARALYLVREHGVTPKSITLLAFNNKAAGELKERWAEMSLASLPYQDKSEKEVSFSDDVKSKWALPELSISTMHSYGFSLFSKFLTHRPESDPLKKAFGTRFSILSEYSSIKLYKKVAKEFFPDEGEGNMKTVLAFYYHIETLAAKNLIYPILAMAEDLVSAPTADNPESTITKILESLTKEPLDGINPLPSPYLLQSNHTTFIEVLNAKAQRRESPLKYKYSAGLVKDSFNVALETLKEFKGWSQIIKPQALCIATQCKIIRAFYLLKYQSRALSFSDMIFLPNLLYSHVPALKDAFSKEISQYVLADESQDLDSLQMSLLFQMWQRGYAMIGDSHQWLYSFRAADFNFLENLQTISDAYHPFTQQKDKSFEKFSILKNYRCPPTIVDLANRAASEILDMEPIEAIAHKGPSDRTIVIREYESSKDELAEIAMTIKQLQQEQGVELHDILVLSRTNRVLSQLEPHMIRMGLPYRMRMDSKSIINQSAYQWITSVYSLIVNPNDITALLEVVESVKGFGDAYLRNLQYELDDPLNRYYETQDKTPVLKKIFSKIGNSKQKEISQRVLSSFIDPLLSVYQRILGQGKGVPEVNRFILNLTQAVFNMAPDRIRMMDEGQKAEEKDQSPTEKPGLPHIQMDMYSLNRVLGFTESIYETCRNVLPEEVSPIEHYEDSNNGSFFDAVFGSSAKNEFVETPLAPQLQKSEMVLFQEVYSALYQSFTEDVEEEVDANGQTVPIKKGRSHKNKVLLSTIHSSKGGQADYVLYCGLALFNAVQESEETPEACCHYVALTRAKKRLYISHAQTVEGFDGVPKRAIPSPFFKQTMQHVQDMVREKQAQAQAS